ncbi:hypothetical protein NFI96_022671 [Prochilodus magdalenae]|nr:hypothetical protein NFI96_022671 [Prochilodus magdalenae]
MSPLSAKLKLGMALSFHGVVPVDAKEFEINLQTGLSDGDDKAFCFKTSIGNKVAMNSFQNGKWENEESAPAKPFTSGAAFSMVFVVKPQGYEVYVNEIRHCLFHHRIPWEKVSALVIGGDVSMNLLGVINVSKGVSQLTGTTPHKSPYNSSQRA